MNEPTRRKIEESCTEIARNICTHPKHGKWLEAAFNQTDSLWHGVVAEVARQGCPVDEIKELPEEVIRVFVYTCIKAPYFNKTGEVLILFTLAGWIWSTSIRCTPAPINTEPDDIRGI
jgi:hypothetical protein